MMFKIEIRINSASLAKCLQLHYRPSYKVHAWPLSLAQPPHVEIICDSGFKLPLLRNRTDANAKLILTYPKYSKLYGQFPELQI